MKIPADIPDLKQLYEQTVALSHELHPITSALAWVDQVLPMLAPACRATLAAGSSETDSLDRWLAWVDSGPALLEQAGRGAMLHWRQEWLRILLTATIEFTHDAAKRTARGQEETAAKLWSRHDTLSPCFPREFWRDLVGYLCVASEDGNTQTSLRGMMYPYRISFPLIVSEPVIDGGIETNAIMAEFVLEPVGNGSGAVFLHPEQAAVRCMDDSFARSFEHATEVVREGLDLPGAGLPDVRVRILTINPGHERFLNGTLLHGPSAGGALALGLHSLYTMEPYPAQNVAVSFALAESRDSLPDGRCHAVEGTADKVRGCARMGVKSLLVAKENEASLARYGHIHRVEIIGVTTFSRAAEAFKSLAAVFPGSQATKSRKITLLYKRHREPDESLARMLLAQLSHLGHHVFIDRHLPIGIRWAQEIEHQIRAADAVIPLLSEAAVTSEMFQYEIEAAREAAATQGGRPAILPIRARFDGSLREPLATILNPIQFASWKSAEDNSRLIREIAVVLENPPDPRPLTDRARLEPPFGVVPLESRFYVDRTTDEEFNEAVARGDSIVLVRGPRQIGKTSLLARGLRQARDSGARVVWMDLQKLNSAQLASPEALYLTLAEALADQLDLNVFPNKVWTSSSGPNVNFERYLKREVLPKVETPLVWGLDEVDRLFDCSFKDETFGLFRAWHNQRAFDPSGMWGRLTLVMAYATEARLFITDLNQSPFNVGTRLTLQDLTQEQTAELNDRYGSPLRNAAELHEFTEMTGGQPFLVRRGLHEMKARGLSFEAVRDSAARDDGPFGDHLHRLLASLAHNPRLLDVMRGMVRGEPCTSEEDFYRLRSAGVVKGTTASTVRCRCRLYEQYLGKHLHGTA